MFTSGSPDPATLIPNHLLAPARIGAAVRSGTAARPGEGAGGVLLATEVAGSAGVVVGAPVSGPGVDRFEHAMRPGQCGGHRIGVGVDVRHSG
jgi:hypothetical protein